MPRYNIDARGGFGTNDEVDGAEYIVDYVPFKDAKMDDICVPVVGNSMAPTYVSGSIVLLHAGIKKRTFQILWRASECAEMFRQINDKR